MAFTKIAAAGIGSTETVTLHSLEVLNNATVGGVLTYEDVTNVDSIGIVTARAGVLVGSGITLSKDGDIFATGITTITGLVDANGGAHIDNLRLGIDADNDITTSSGNLTLDSAAGNVVINDNLDVDGTATFDGVVSIADKIVHTGDINTAIRFPTADTITAETGGDERLRINSVGTFMVQHTSSRNNFFGATSTEHAAAIQLEGTNQKRLLSITSANTSDGGTLILARQNGDAGTNTVVANNNQIGRIDFQGNDGTNFETAAIISAEIDGTPGNDDMPGRLLFKTTADGAKTPTERVRINSSGLVGIGTDIPDQKLNVVDGIINVGAAVTSNDTRIQFTRKDTGIFSWVGIPNWAPSSFYIYGPKNTSPFNEVVVSYASSTFNFFTGGTERMSIGANGHLTFQDGKRCAFNVKGSSMTRTNADNFKVEFNNDTSSGCFDSGNNFDTSAHEFEAPVSGYYFFHTTLRLDGWSSGYIRMGILSTSYNEGLSWWSIPSTGHVIKYSGSSNIDELTTSTTMYLPATHKAYVYLVVQNETSFTVMLSESSFSGHLIG